MVKRILSRIISVFISLFLALLLIELLIRSTSKLESKYNFKNWKVSDINFAINHSPYRPSYIFGIGYELIPDVAPFVNKYGMIGKAYNLEKDKNCFRILVIGDSITERNWYVEKLEELLNMNKNLKHRFELWNAGVGGYNLGQYYYYLKYKLLKYHPDMIVIGLGLDDFNISMVVCYKDGRRGLIKYRFPLYGYRGLMRYNLFLLKHSYLYRLLLAKIDDIVKPVNKYKENDGEFYLAGIKGLCKKHKIPLICFIFPYLKPYNEYYFVEKENIKKMLNTVNELKIDYMDLAPFFPEEKRYSLRLEENKEDYIHPNEEGHQIAAQAIYSYICKNYFNNNH